jgi:hypothetical protein
MRSSRGIVSSFLILSSLAALAQAYPIPPQTLWDLTSSSERIVVARVERIERDAEGEIAELRVIETWKGPFTDVVRVRFWAGLVCPAPPRYLEGREVLAFLERSESEPEIWMTVGLSYGTLYPAVEERQSFWRLVRRLETETPPFSRQFEKDWHVDAASQRATRWHGLYRLDRRADALHAFYDRPLESPESLVELLTVDDRESIAKGFLEEPSSDVTFPMALELLRDFESTELDTTAAALLEGLLLMEPPPYWTAHSMVLVLERFGDPDGMSRLGLPIKPEGDPLLDLVFWEDKDVELETVWVEARRELGIPNVAPLVVRQEHVEGVGAFTPP